MDNIIIEQFFPELEGIIWPLEGKVSRDIKHFETINYLFNGGVDRLILSKRVSSHALIVTSAFGHPIYLYILEDSDKSGLSIAEEKFRSLGLKKYLIFPEDFKQYSFNRSV